MATAPIGTEAAPIGKEAAPIGGQESAAESICYRDAGAIGTIGTIGTGKPIVMLVVWNR